MLTTVEGVFRNGEVKLVEPPRGVHGDTRVLVTFLSSSQVDLRERKVGEAEAAELRMRLLPFAEDWESPEMSIYDDYDAAREAL